MSYVIKSHVISEDALAIFHQGADLDYLIDLMDNLKRKTLRNIKEKYEIYKIKNGTYSLCFLEDVPLDNVLQLGRNKRISQLSFIGVETSCYTKMMDIMNLQKEIFICLDLINMEDFLREIEEINGIFPNVLELNMANFLADSDTINRIRKIFPNLNLLEFPDPTIGNEIAMKFNSSNNLQ